MKKPELIFVSGCNAAGKSTFIRIFQDLEMLLLSAKI